MRRAPVLARAAHSRLGLVLSYLAVGDSYEEILDAHPDLVRDDILAAIG